MPIILLSYLFRFHYIVALFILRYRDGAGNTIEENSSVFSLIRMH